MPIDNFWRQSIEHYRAAPKPVVDFENLCASKLLQLVVLRGNNNDNCKEEDY